MVDRLPQDAGVDWWALGVLAYELLTGWPPFTDRNHEDDVEGLFQRIRQARVTYPDSMSAEAQDFIGKLLVHNPFARLGNCKVQPALHAPAPRGSTPRSCTPMRRAASRTCARTPS